MMAALFVISLDVLSLAELAVDGGIFEWRVEHRAGSEEQKECAAVKKP